MVAGKVEVVTEAVVVIEAVAVTEVEVIPTGIELKLPPHEEYTEF